MKSMVALIIAAAVMVTGLYLYFKYNKEVSSSEFWIKDKAVAYSFPDDYREFRKELREYPPGQQEAFAASWITSEKVTLLPAQRVVVLAQDPPLLKIRTQDGKILYTTISQLSDGPNPEPEDVDVAEQMVKGD